MAAFVYEAYDAEGRAVEGRVEARSHAEALSSLRAQGLQVESLLPEAESHRRWSGNTPLSWEDVHLLCIQLTSLARSNMPLSPGIRSMAADLQRPHLKKALDTVQQDIENGHTLSAALDRQEGTFPYLLIAMLRSGEASGNLPAVLRLCAQHSRRMANLKQDVIAASVYPLFLLFLGILILGAMMVWVVPAYAEIFMEFGGQLPLATRLLVLISEVVQLYWPHIITGMCLLTTLVYVFVRGGRRFAFFPHTRETALRISPILGTIHYRDSLARFFQSLATLVEAQVPIVESISLAGAASGSERLRKVANELASQQDNGFDLSQSMNLSGHFTNHMCWMVSIGEQNNDLETALRSLAESLDRETRHLDKIFLNLIVPVMTLFLGAIFMFIIVALYQPIFTLGNMF